MAERNDPYAVRGQLSLWFTEDLYGGGADQRCHQTDSICLQCQNGFAKDKSPQCQLEICCLSR